jgi:hypothetical protein
MVRTHGAGCGLDVKDANGSVAGICASPFLDICELSRSGAAGETKLCPHALAGRRKSFSAAIEKFRDRHRLAPVKVVENDRRGRKALLRQSVGKLNRENYLRHFRQRMQSVFQR